MKFQVLQEKLNKALGLVARVAGGSTSLPILSNVLFVAEKNRLKIAATNLEIAITLFIGGKISEEGSVTVPARLLQDFIATLPNDAIDIEVRDDTKMNISSGQYTANIAGVAVDDFPSIPVIRSDEPLILGAKEFKKALQQTIVASSNDEVRPVLTGVYLHVDESSLYIAATDSYRLAEKRLGPADKEVSLIIPATALQEVLRVIDDSEESIEIHYDDSQAMFRYGETELVTRLIDGQFPAYRQLIPTESSSSFVISRSEFANITKVASLFARESAGSITLSVSEEDQTVSIHSVASQIGENTSRSTAKIEGGGEVTLNSRYLLDALNVMHSDAVAFRFSGKLSPCVITPADQESSDYTHIVMPLKS